MNIIFMECYDSLEVEALIPIFTMFKSHILCTLQQDTWRACITHWSICTMFESHVLYILEQDTLGGFIMSLSLQITARHFIVVESCVYSGN